MKLYEIAATYRQALRIFNDCEVDIPDSSLISTLSILSVDFEEKAINVAAYTRHLEVEAEAIKTAMVQMENRKKTLEERAKSLKDYIKSEMISTGMMKITSSPWFTLSVQTNPAALEIYDEKELPNEYITTRQVTETIIDKMAIKKSIASGFMVPGARLTNGTRLVIR